MCFYMCTHARGSRQWPNPFTFKRWSYLQLYDTEWCTVLHIFSLTHLLRKEKQYREKRVRVRVCVCVSAGDYYLFAIFIMLSSLRWFTFILYALLGYNQISTVLFINILTSDYYHYYDDDDNDVEMMAMMMRLLLHLLPHLCKCKSELMKRTQYILIMCE